MEYIATMMVGIELQEPVIVTITTIKVNYTFSTLNGVFTNGCILDASAWSHLDVVKYANLYQLELVESKKLAAIKRMPEVTNIVTDWYTLRHKWGDVPSINMSELTKELKKLNIKSAMDWSPNGTPRYISPMEISAYKS